MPKRRRDWLLGRWTAKHLIREHLKQAGPPPPLDEIEIHADADGSPYATLAGEWLPLSVSISHSGAYSFCALTDEAGATVGADLELIEPRPLSLAEQFFTVEELAAVLARPDTERDVWITLVWSAKEAYLKSIKEGLRVDTRAVTVEIPSAAPSDRAWQPLALTAPARLGSGEYRAWWQREGEMVLTLGLLTNRG